MTTEELKEKVWEANMALPRLGLITLTWGNVSGIDRERNLVAIKPSGVPYDKLTKDDIVVVDMDGNRVEGEMNPSSDLPTHLVLYKMFPEMGGVVHTHSTFATSWAQACRSIPALGTTHGDVFYGSVPVTRAMKKAEIEDRYEYHTGTVIAECFQKRGIDPNQIPAVLVRNHGPFAWGKNPMSAVENALTLEKVAEMALYTERIANALHRKSMPGELLDKHFLRKHGKNAYYGQKEKEE